MAGLGEIVDVDAYVDTVNALTEGAPEEMEAPSAGESMADIFAAMEEYNPELAAQMWDLLQLYAPQEQQLAYDSAAEMLPQYYDLYAALISAERTGNMEDVLRLAGYLPQIQEAAQDPAITAMKDELLRQINEELAMGSSLTAEQARNAEEYLRSAQIARGTSAGQGAANRESVAKALEGMALQTERQGKAQSMVSAYGQPVYDPFAAILGGTPSATSMAASQYNAGLPMTQTLAMLPTTDYYSSQYWNAYNADAEAQQYNTSTEMAYNNWLSTQQE